MEFRFKESSHGPVDGQRVLGTSDLGVTVEGPTRGKQQLSLRACAQPVSLQLLF